MEKPRVGFFDIENAPHLGWVWEKYETNVIDFKKQGYLLCFSVKWLGEKTVKTYSLPDYPTYKKDKENDKALVKDLHRFMSEADVIIAHNGDRFDIKKANARFLVHGLTPPPPYKTVDTLKIARKVADFPSNKLDDLGRDLKVGRKLANEGKHLWFGCMSGDKKAWEKMKSYNAQDVILLEKVYFKLRSWAPHPDLRMYDKIEGCPTCRSPRIQRRGIHYTKTRAYQQYLCKDCRTWFRGVLIKNEN